jgi:AraC-like DNA-binding protein
MSAESAIYSSDDRWIDDLSGGGENGGMSDFRTVAQRLAPVLGDTAYNVRPSVLPVPMLVSAGHERQSDPRRYQWDGMRRAHDEKCPQGVPHAIVQWTLSGSGRYADASGERALPPGQAFIALVPSAHRYWLPADGAPWTFVWFAVSHPQILERLQMQVARHGAVFTIDPGGALAQRLIELVEGLFRRSFIDDFALETALWAYLTESDRQLDRLARPPESKRALLDRVRDLVMAELAEPLGAADIAGRLGLHRVYFAERFRAATGFTPGVYITSLRLDEARRRLRDTADGVDAVAKAVGLGSASHLCRLFRRHYGGTPGSFRSER